MKKIFFLILIFLSIKSSGQFPNMTTPQSIGSKKTRVTALGGLDADSILSGPTGCGSPTLYPAYQGSQIRKFATYFDSCNHRYWIYDPKVNYWDTLHVGSVSSIVNTNLGSGYRILSPSSQGLRTIFNSYGFNWDSTLNANGLTGTIDSLVFVDWYRLYKVRDSLLALIGATPTLQEVTTAGNTTFNPISITYSSAGTSAFSTINQNAGSGIYASNTGSGMAGNFELEHTSTNAVRDIVSYGRLTTGTAAAGLGQKHKYLLEADAGGSYEAASLNILWDDATEAAATSRVVFNTMSTGSVLNTLTLNGNAQIQFNEYTGSNFNTAQAKVAMIGTDGKVYGVDTTGLFGSGGGSSYTTENAQDDVFGAITANAPLTGTYNDGANTYTLALDTSTAIDNSVMTNDRGQKLLDSLQVAGWGQQSVSTDYKFYMDMSNNTQANGFFSSTGTGSSATVPSTAPYSGWFYGRQLVTGTTTTGRAYCLSFNAGYSPIAIDNSYRFRTGARIRLEDLSDGTDTYGFMFGFVDDVNNYSSVVDGVGFRYTDADSSGAFIAWTKNNGTITEDATTTTVAADTEYFLQVEVYGGNAYFYINGVLKSTISTNIPTGTTRITSLGISIHKSAGTTSRTLYVPELGYDKRYN